MQLIKTWIKALTNPKETFAEEKKHASFDEGARNIFLGGLAYGLVLLLIAPPASLLLAAQVLLHSVARLFLTWVATGYIFYLFAKLFNGRGKLQTQLFLMSLYMPLIAIIAIVLNLIPVAGQTLFFLVIFYSFYLLTFALMEVHKFSKNMAIISWAVPTAIFTILAAAFFLVFSNPYQFT